MTNFTNLATLVAQGQALLDEIKGGKLAEMQTEHNQLIVGQTVKHNEMVDNYKGVVARINAAIPSAINQSMKKIVYVDQVLGDDANDGRIDTPVATFFGATRLTVSGGVIEIRVMSDYTFSDVENVAAFYAMSVYVRSEDMEDPVTIKFSHYQAGGDMEQYHLRGFAMYFSGSFEFFKIKLELPDVPSAHGIGKRYPHAASVVRTNSSGNVANILNIRLSDVELIVPAAATNEFHFVGNPSGYTNFVMVNTVVPIEYRDRNKMIYQSRLSDTSVARQVVNTGLVLSASASVYNRGVVE